MRYVQLSVCRASFFYQARAHAQRVGQGTPIRYKHPYFLLCFSEPRFRSR